MMLGIFLIALGGLFLLDNLGFLPNSGIIWSMFWPVVVIIIGIRLVMNSSGCLFCGNTKQGQKKEPWYKKITEAPEIKK